MPWHAIHSELNFLNTVKETGRKVFRMNSNEEESCMNPLRERVGDHQPTVQPNDKIRVKQR